MVISSSTGATSSGITSPSQDVVDSELDSWIYLFHWQDILSIETTMNLKLMKCKILLLCMHIIYRSLSSLIGGDPGGTLPMGIPLYCGDTVFSAKL